MAQEKDTNNSSETKKAEADDLHSALEISPDLLNYSVVKQLLDLMEDGVVLHDHSRRIYLVNRATEHITGHRLEEIIGALGYEVGGEPVADPVQRQEVLERLARKEITSEQAFKLLNAE